MQVNYNRVLTIVLGLVALYYVWVVFLCPSSQPIEMEMFAAKKSEESAPVMSPAVSVVVDGPSGGEAGSVNGMEYDSHPGAIPSNFYMLDDGSSTGFELGVMNNIASPDCCSNSQWPVPFKTGHDDFVCNNKSEFVPTNMYGQSTVGNHSGCLCVTKKQALHQLNRGNNGRTWF